MSDKDNAHTSTLYAGFLVALLTLAVVAFALYRSITPPAMTPDTAAEERIAPVAAFAKTDNKAPAAVAPAAAPAAAAPATDPAAIYAAACHLCHETGVAGAPKKGDKAAWAPRIATGMDALYQSMLHGKGAMPPRGNTNGISDEALKATVDYLVDFAK